MRMQSLGVPIGAYRAEFSGTKETNHAEYGPGLVWQFIIHGGQFDGQTVGRVTGVEPNPRNKAGELFRSIVGQAAEGGADVALEDYAGRLYHIVVGQAPSGNGTRVESVVPIFEGGE